ncbi:MAG: ATP-dependent protease ATPase subunit HslU [Bdellovibrionota bacterium]|nr:ATP-dependent protease ATPase subunit HslU [Bdellovibrionota bacterium]
MTSRELTPKEIVKELDKYIVAQTEAKKAVAVALRNRWRRMQLDDELKEEITPKNILMIGATGVGKTEISRRLAKFVNAPFIKVEASKFTEVGYVGRDVESIIRELMDSAYHLVKNEEKEKVKEKALIIVNEKILDCLMDDYKKSLKVDSNDGKLTKENIEKFNKKREALRKKLEAGKLENEQIEFRVTKQVHTQMQIMGPMGMGEIEGQIKDIFSNMIPKQKEKKVMQVKDARKIMLSETSEDMLNEEKIVNEALRRAEQSGIVFIDEIDKIASVDKIKGGDVAREGVQRDLLPLVEGCSVGTKYGNVKTDHILFIASGAFHTSKPSDLMPEFQGRFPIRVELEDLTAEHLEKILKEPKHALTKQYEALLGVEGVKLQFKNDGIKELAKYTALVNQKTENIGARRLHTLLEKILEDVSFNASEMKNKKVVVDAKFVKKELKDIVDDEDLSRYIL